MLPMPDQPTGVMHMARVCPNCRMREVAEWPCLKKKDYCAMQDRMNSVDDHWHCECFSCGFRFIGEENEALRRIRQRWEIRKTERSTQ